MGWGECVSVCVGGRGLKERQIGCSNVASFLIKLLNIAQWRTECGLFF